MIDRSKIVTEHLKMFGRSPKLEELDFADHIAKLARNEAFEEMK